MCLLTIDYFNCIARCFLLNMTMVIDVLLAVAVVAVTPGAVAELQLRVGSVSSATYSAFMIVVGFWCGLFLSEWDRAAGGGRTFFPAAKAILNGQEIDDVLSGEQQVVAQCYKWEQVVGEVKCGEGEVENVCDHDYKIDNCNDPTLDRYNKEDQELTVRIGGGEG